MPVTVTPAETAAIITTLTKGMVVKVNTQQFSISSHINVISAMPVLFPEQVK